MGGGRNALHDISGDLFREDPNSKETAEGHQRDQLTSVYVVTSENIHSTNWVLLGHFTMIYAYGMLFAVVNSWSLGNLSLRVYYDIINNKFDETMSNLRYRRATYFQRLKTYSNFVPGPAYNCGISAAIDELALLHSEIHMLVCQTYEIMRYQILWVLVFLFVNNVSGLFQLYFTLGNLLERDLTIMTIAIRVTVLWNLLDIFLLFYAASLVNEGSVCDSWRNLYRQFDSRYNNLDLDRSVSYIRIYM